MGTVKKDNRNRLRREIVKNALIGISILLILAACGGGGSDGGASEKIIHSFNRGTAGFYYNPPTLVGDYIYIGTSRGFLYDVASDNYFFKLDLNLNGVWEYSLGSKEVRGGAALDNAGNIYFALEEGRLKGNASNSKLYLYSLGDNGAFRWSKLITSSVYNMGMSNPAISAGDTIYIGGDKFYAFDKDGNEKWTYGNNMTIMNAPILDPNGNIYFSASGSIISLSQSGTVRWIFNTSGEFLSSPAFSTDYTKIYVGVGDKIYSLETSAGTKVWEFTPTGMVGTFRATPAVDNNNNVYIGTKASSGSVFYAIKSDGSGLLWKNTIGADLYSSPALGKDNTLYVGSEYTPTRLHALDMTTGNKKWSISLGADVNWSSPVLTNNGTLYISSMDYLGSGGGVYAVRTDSFGFQPNAGSPRFHGSNSNTGRRE